jgi:RND family efflux transporter MFP subunit
LRLLSLVLWLIPLGLLGGAGYYAYSQYQKIRPKVTVSTTPVREMSAGEAGTLLSAKGYLKSRFQAMIGAKVPGRVEKMLVEEGSKVKQGDLLAILEHDELQAQLESRKAMIAKSKADLAEAKADLVYKDSKARRQVRLQSLNQASAEEAEQAIADRNMTAARVRALEASIGLQQATAHEVEESIDDMHIVAPFDGTVVEKAAEVGETITPGGMGAASGRGSVATLANLMKLEVETDIAENMLARIGAGQPAEVAVAAVPDRRYKGRLRSIVPMGDRARGTIKVYVEIVDPDERLFPELVATVHFLPHEVSPQVAKPPKGLYIPRSAVLERGGESAAWVVDPRGFAHLRTIKVAVEGDRARVEEGLKAGESVVVAPPEKLEDGQEVKIED